MLKVRVKKTYFDKVRDEYPEVNSEFDVEEKRANVLVEADVFYDTLNLVGRQTLLAHCHWKN